MKKYTITVIDNETGKPADVNGRTIQADTDVLLIAWGEENGVRKVGLNQAAWDTNEKRSGAIRALLEMADNLCGGPDEEAATDALAGFLAEACCGGCGEDQGLPLLRSARKAQKRQSLCGVYARLGRLPRV